MHYKQIFLLIKAQIKTNYPTKLFLADKYSMRKILLIITVFFSFCASAQIDKIISTPPNPPKLVNDYTNTLTQQQKEALEAKLVRYDDSTSNQIAVVIIDKLDGYSIEDAAIELGRKCGQ
jgi:uncharacterized protein